MLILYHMLYKLKKQGKKIIIKNKIEEINDIIKLKFEKKDLDDIYNINNKNKNEINNIKLKLEEISLGIEKIRNDNPNFIKRLESLTNEVSKLKNNFGIKIGDKIINERKKKQGRNFKNENDL